jgi:CDP-glucose 4,6-dehydratase
MEGLGVTPSFWTDKRVFLTGHTGFKGSWLALWLSELGAEVTGYALAPDTTPSLFDDLALASRVHSIIADVRDAERVRTAMRDARPDVVMHLAAQSLVRRSYEVPVETLATNVMGTAHVLDAVRHTPGVRAALIVTTDKCYENREWAWGYREDDVLGGHDLYSSSKACAELVTAAYRKSFLAQTAIGVATVRAGNVIGGGDWSLDRIVPDLVRAALRSQPAIVRNPNSTRPWQHVLDVLGGYLLLTERLVADPTSYAQAWNFGPPNEDVRSVSDLATTLCKAWGASASWHHEATAAVHEAHALTLDASKARAKLGWRPRLAFANAVGWTVDWYKAEGDKARVTLDQLRRYQEAV